VIDMAPANYVPGSADRRLDKAKSPGILSIAQATGGLMRYLTVIAALAMVPDGAAVAAQQKSPVSARKVATPTVAYSLTPANKRDIVAQVKDKLLDGESARWRWPKHVAEFGLYCGFVNAKNRMGAYTGFTPFMVLGGVGDGPKSTGQYKVFSATLGTDDPSDTDTAVVTKMCADKGYDLSSVPPE
jgi:hypothetical protein